MKQTLISLFGEKWFYKLEPFLTSSTFLNMGKTINNLRLERKIYPDKENVFRVFKESNPDEINVVFLINQSMDKYYCGHPICGCESLISTKILKNWYEELYAEYPELENRLTINNSIDLVDFKYLRDQGVFFLNTQLTDDDKVGWNHELLWKPFITEVVKSLSVSQHIVWVLLGVNCFEYEKLIPLQDKLIKVPYPTLNEFIGCGIFRKINFKLNKEIEW